MEKLLASDHQKLMLYDMQELGKLQFSAFRKLRGGGWSFFFVGMLKTFFASLCSFICLQAVHQLSGPED